MPPAEVVATMTSWSRLMVCGPRSTQAEEAEDRQDHHDEPDEIDNAVHFWSLRDAVLMSHKSAMPQFGCLKRTIVVQVGPEPDGQNEVVGSAAAVR